MKYYEMHEVMYKKIQEEGKLSWSKSESFEEMWQHGTNTNLEKYLSQIGLDFSGLEVLDLGTGTGTSALFCSKQGAFATGVEISKTAIEIAKKNAQELKLSTQFIQADVLELNLNKKFDLVIDSTILHCIVGTEDRSRFFEVVKKHLNENGLVFFNTMISSEDMSNAFPREYFHFENEILWSLGISEIEARKVINGKSYFPHRTLLSEHNQRQEFLDHGFEIVHSDIAIGESVNCLVGLLKVKDI